MNETFIHLLLKTTKLATQKVGNLKVYIQAKVPIHIKSWVRCFLNSYNRSCTFQVITTDILMWQNGVAKCVKPYLKITFWVEGGAGVMIV